MDNVPYRLMNRVGFMPYSSEEIKKLSVLEITNLSIFDDLDHPSDGGLYDRALGPCEKNDICSTCGLNAFHCPGHYGHINLPLPVFSPLFIKILMKLLRGSCFSCHRLLAPQIAVQLALHQFEALDYGLIGTVQELEEMATDLSPSQSKGKSSLDVVPIVTQKLKEILQKAISGLDLKSAQENASVKNVVECRQRIMKIFIKDHLMSVKSKCSYCGSRKKAISLRNNCRFVMAGGQKNLSVRLRIPTIKVEKDGEEDSEHLQVLEDSSGNVDITAKEAKEHLHTLWHNEGTLLGSLFGILRGAKKAHVNPMDVFFIEVIMVPPVRFRPINVVKGSKLMNTKTASLKEILQDSFLLKTLLLSMKNAELTDGEKETLSKLQGKTNTEKLHILWYKLQAHVNVLLDVNLDKFNSGKSIGVKQVVEGKEGLFRGHMMGKRVNYVARSVISPDSNIMVDEIGVPEVFAKKLTYPEPVTAWNVEKLRAAVLNGPDIHPGAVAVENEEGYITLLSDEQMRHSHAACLLTPDFRSAVTMKPKKVHRHLRNGDVLLMNRQPTLHKPSIMAHKARVLPGEKTLRLHYANCKSYNADFDGDEMNAHFPQNEIARSEGYNIVSVNHQYLVPKDGTPLSGLIQDHIASSTLLTMRGKFFTGEQYQQLVYNAIPDLPKKIKTLPPSILKPQVLWSGKQVVSTVIINVIPEGKKPVTVEGKSKLSSKTWQNAPKRIWQAGGQLIGDEMTESEVIIHSGELLCGVLDKAHIGPTPYGLVHCCYELYGGRTSNLLLTSLGRLFISYLGAIRTFSLGVEDILLTSKATKKRKKVMQKASKVGDETTAKALNVTDVDDHMEVVEKYRDVHLSKDPIGLKQLDFEMKKVTDGFNNDINNICMPSGLSKKFPQNSLQLLVQSGAKGSTVNCMQISCLLGQIELEGRRVPLTINGNSLPSFWSYDTSPRAGGFVDGMFLTGIAAKEFFFHCMAGREGLVDTAVKTSRSGYLQRCIIKHMEGLMVNYDMTVRDSDGSVIQFLYGEDGLDVTKMQMLKPQQFPALVKNYEAVVNKEEIDILKSRQITEDPAAYKKLVSRWQRKFGRKCEDQNLRITADWLKKHKKKCPDPLASFVRPDLTLGSVSELLDNAVEAYIKKNPHGCISDEWKTGQSVTPEMFREMMHYRALKSLAQPGEPVGLLAAQSIGEPSTQMTLNTFHFAGRGEMNVTLGIPRLREILMVASANIATPSMDLPLLNIPNAEEEAEKLRIELTAVHLKQVLEYVEVIDEIHIKSKCNCFREYKIKMKFLRPEVYQSDLYANTEKILKYIEEKFIKKVVDVLKKKLARTSGAKIVSISSHKVKSDIDVDTPPEPAAGNGGVDDGSSGEEEGEGDAVDVESRTRHNQDANYQEPEDEEKFDGASEDEDLEEAKEETAAEQVEDPENRDIAYEPPHEKVAMDANKAARINFVKGIHGWVSNYDYDIKKRNCEFSLMLNLKNSATDIKSLIENEINKAVVHELPRINRAFIVRDSRSKDDQKKMLKTEGVNFLEIFKYDNVIDMKRIYSNDIHAIASFLGIEAANRVIVKEVSSVFAIYGIEVDTRHLLLIADYMTYDGFYKPFNRIGLESNASPLQQMSFETTLKFFTDATLTGAEDMLKSPSSKLVVGHLVGGGTGSFDLLLKPYKPDFKKMW